MEIYNQKVKRVNGQEVELSEYKGKVVLIVNVASECGFTPQYEGLQALYEKYKDQGLVILGFPCDQFGGQEPGTDNEIESFCTGRFGVKFPIFSKVDVNGDKALPLFTLLKEEAPGILGSKSIKWNFTKFLVGRDGKVIKRFAPNDKPESMVEDIEKILSK